MIWDFCPDMMHIIKTFFDRLVLGVFSGARKPTKFNQKEPVDPGWRASQEDKKEYRGKKRKYDDRKVEYEKALEAFEGCLFDADAQKIVDERVKNLVGYPNWIKASLVHSRIHIAHSVYTYYPKIICIHKQYVKNILTSYDLFVQILLLRCNLYSFPLIS
jgi:hypothetical protein